MNIERAPRRPCRSCHAPIVWAITLAGRRMPLDPDPVDGGNVVIESVFAEGSVVRQVNVRVLTHAEVAPGLFDQDAEPRYVSHFVTCPDADEHRRP